MSIAPPMAAIHELDLAGPGLLDSSAGPAFDIRKLGTRRRPGVFSK